MPRGWIKKGKFEWESQYPFKSNISNGSGKFEIKIEKGEHISYVTTMYFANRDVRKSSGADDLNEANGIARKFMRETIINRKGDID